LAGTIKGGIEMKKVLGVISVALISISLSACGNEKVESVESEEPLITDEEMEKLYEIHTTTFGQIEVPTEDLAYGKEPLFPFERVAEILQGSQGTELTPQLMYDMFVGGYDIATDPYTNTHEYFIYELVEDTGNWIRVKFNETDTVVEEVETNLAVNTN